MRPDQVKRIGGLLTMDVLAQLHRPRDAQGMQAAARDMQRLGLKPADIATHLRLTELAVVALLQSPHIHSGERQS